MFHGLRIEPLDVLFFRDGRPFDAAMRATSGLPLPQTLAGALRTALLSRSGFDFAAFSEARSKCAKVGQDSQDALKQALRAGHASEKVIQARFRGPWPAVFLKEKPVPLFAQPQDLIKVKNSTEFVSLWPGKMAGWTEPDLDGLLPLVRASHLEIDSKASPRLFSLTAVQAYLRNQLRFDEQELFDPGDVYGFENRTGIGVNADTLAAADRMIYGISFLSLKTRLADEKKHGKYAGAPTGLYAEIDSPFSREEIRSLLADPIPLGGESRYAKVTVLPPLEWPKVASGSKSKWLLVTPGFLAYSAKTQRLLPTVPGLKAAASAAGVAVSGWDVAKRGPRATRFAVPAGAVYYFDSPVPLDGYLGGSNDDKAEGWGFALPGHWEEAHA